MYDAPKTNVNTAILRRQGDHAYEGLRRRHHSQPRARRTYRIGKTQLASAILAVSGMVNRFGKVDDGTAVTDFDEEEIARHHTLSAHLAYAEWNKHKINLIDTPGMGNFFCEAKAALRVADAALVDR